MPKVPNFVGPSYNLDTRAASVQRTINMVPVPLEAGNERVPWVFKDAPGLVSWSAAPAPVDPDFESVILLLRADSDGGTDFLDSSLYGHTTAKNGIEPATSNPKFGDGQASSTALAGTSINTTSATTGDTFTVTQDTSVTFEGWHWYYNPAEPGDAASYNIVRGDVNGNGTYYFRVIRDPAPNRITLRVQIESTSADTAQQTLPAPLYFPIQEWFFWSLVYNGATKRAYVHINGVPRVAVPFAGSFTGALDAVWNIQDTASSPAGSQQFDDMRVTWQVARYTEAETYTPPTQAFPNIGP